MNCQSCIFLGIKVKPGAIERHKVENFSLDGTVESLKTEAEKKANVPSASLELIHHGKILKDGTTLLESGVKSGEMVHVVKKKSEAAAKAPPTVTDADLQQIVCSLRAFGCTPSAPGWTRAMQVLNDESTMSEILDAVPSLSEDCVTLSVLHEIELLAALGATIHTMRRGGQARPNLPAALGQLTRIVRTSTGTTDNVPTSGFAYSLEALSEDEDGDEEEGEAGTGTITAEQLAVALMAATEAVSASGARPSGSQESLWRFLQTSDDSSRGTTPAPTGEVSTTPSSTSNSGAGRSFITSDMFSEAMSEAMNVANSSTASGTPMEQSTTASSSQSPGGSLDFSSQVQHMREMGLLNDSINVRALLICSGDVNAAINLVFSGAIEE